MQSGVGRACPSRQEEPARAAVPNADTSGFLEQQFLLEIPATKRLGSLGVEDDVTLLWRTETDAHVSGGRKSKAQVWGQGWCPLRPRCQLAVAAFSRRPRLALALCTHTPAISPPSHDLIDQGATYDLV